MIFRFLKCIYRLIIGPIKICKVFGQKYFNFILPNLFYLYTKRCVGVEFPMCEQKTYLTGLGKIEFGENCYFGCKLGGFHKGGSIEFQPRYKNSIIKIGNNVATNNNIFFCVANYLEIGDDTLIGQYVCIMDHEAHGVAPEERRSIGEIGNVVIGKNVWIGNNVTILKNSKIGDNVIIATGAVVAGIFPANSIIGGVPARIIKQIKEV